MTYLGSATHYPLGAVSQDKTPSQATDLIKTWAEVKDGMRNKLGEFKFADGSLATFEGRRVPMMTAAHARTVHDWMMRIGQRMIATAAGRPVAQIQAAMSRYDSATGALAALASLSSLFQERLTLPQAGAFIIATDNFAIEASAGQWASYNVATRIEMFREALKETTGGSTVLDFWDMGSFFAGHLGTIIKLSVLAGGAFFLWRFVGPLIKKESTP